MEYRYLTLILLGLVGTTASSVVMAAPTPEIKQPSLHLQVTVNSNQDGALQADNALTLREAIAIVNGTLPLDKLSDREKSQVSFLRPNAASQIIFNLPPQQTTIRLSAILPPLASPGLIVDGTTQPGYQTATSTTIPAPVVAITPAQNRDIFRGFTVVADGVTIRGLSIYGFTARLGATATTPPADIFISDRLSPLVAENQQGDLPYQHNNPPKDVLVEYNWLGLPPDASMPPTTSAFGVSVFNGVNTAIRRNRIANHDGSGIITSVKAENLQVIQNIINNNGIAGMPDAIRLEGKINGANVSANLISGNAGSGVFLFKPEGTVQIRNNSIKSNGRRLERAAIYLMGDNHQVINNSISNQPGPGVVVASYPNSDRNRIQGNEFDNLPGLAIDLVTQQNVDPQAYQQGDGQNPPTNSHQRRRKTGNFGIDAPQFISPEFIILNPKSGVTLIGKAEPGSQVEIYRSGQDAGKPEIVGKPIAAVNTDEKGRFSINLGNLKVGDRVSAIATHPKYGTSEPAINTVIRTINNDLEL